jgi:hypothetical protein
MRFRRQFLRKRWLTHLALFHVIMCRTFLSSLTVSNTSSFFTRQVQLISILLQTTFQNWWQQSSAYWIPPLTRLAKKKIVNFIYVFSRIVGAERRGGYNFFVMQYACSVACNWVGQAHIFHPLWNLTSGNCPEVYFQKRTLIYIYIYITKDVFIFAEKIKESPDTLFDSSFSWWLGAC